MGKVYVAFHLIHQYMYYIHHALPTGGLSRFTAPHRDGGQITYSTVPIISFLEIGPILLLSILSVILSPSIHTQDGGIVSTFWKESAGRTYSPP